MSVIIYALIPITVALILSIVTPLLLRNIDKYESKLLKYDFSLKASKSFCIMLIIFTWIFAFTIVLLNILDEMLLVTNLVLYTFEIILVIGCIQAIRQKIVVIKNGIIYTPIFGKTNKYAFGDINKVIESYYSRGMIKYRVYSKNKKNFMFSNYATGSNLLLKCFKEQGIEIK